MLIFNKLRQKFVSPVNQNESSENQVGSYVNQKLQKNEILFGNVVNFV